MDHEVLARATWPDDADSTGGGYAPVGRLSETRIGMRAVATPFVPPRPRTAIPLPFMSCATWAADVASIMAASVLLAPLGATHAIARVAPIAAIGFTGIARAAGAYDFDNLLHLGRSASRVVQGWLTTMLAIAALGYALGGGQRLSVADIAVWLAGGSALLVGSRAVLVTVARRLKKSGAFDGRTAIIGTDAQGVDLAGYIADNDELAIAPVGFFDDHPIPTEVAAALPLPYFGGIAQLVAAIRTGGIDKVFIALPWSDEARLRRIVIALSATPVEIRLAPDKAGFAYARRRVSSMGGLSVITLLERPMTGTQQLQKMVEDRVLALAALLFLAPLMGLVAVAIKLTSPGPVLFRQPREGLNCKSFDILKFRTMHVAHCSRDEVVQARRRDRRITPIGAFLRRSSIDELPQLFNVLLGHMSLVGPRPHAVSTRAGGKLFAEVASTYAARHNVKPGLTGWAQVCGWRGETDTEEKLIRRLEHDLYYVEHWSIWFDLYILGRTGMTVLLQRTAY